MAPRGSRRGRNHGHQPRRGGALNPGAASSAPSSSTAVNEEKNSQSSDTTIEDDHDEISVIPKPAAASTPAPQVTTPRNLIDDPSPNSSPATMPTETPAPTPARSVPPPPSDQTAHSSVGNQVGRGRGGVGGKPATAPSRFKPKTIRRADNEREMLAQKEQARLAGIQAQYAKEQAKLLRRGGGHMRGRGNYMGSDRAFVGRGGGRGDHAGRDVVNRRTAKGLFGVAPQGLKQATGVFGLKREGGGGGSGGSGGGGSSSSGSRSGANKSVSGGRGTGGGGRGEGGSGTSNKGFVNDPEYPDEDSSVPRVNIEDLTKEKDDDVIYIGTQRIPVRTGRQRHSEDLVPVRIERVEHVDRVTVVNTDASILHKKEEDDDDILVVDEKRSSRANRKRPAGETKVKSEPEDNIELSTTIKTSSTPPPVDVSMKDSPESSRDKKEPEIATRPIIESHDPVDLTADMGTPSRSESKLASRREPKHQSHNRKREKMPIIQTEEDRAEWDRHCEDMEILAEELGGLQTVHPVKEVNGDVEMDAPQLIDPKAGRLYLFQFPPILPRLYNKTSEQRPESQVEVRREQRATENWKDNETEVLANGTDGGKDRGSNNIDLSNEPKIKTEDLTYNAARRNQEREPVVPQEGYVGKMTVRKSGRVDLNWGGTNLLVSLGVRPKSLTTGVIVDSRDAMAQGAGGHSSDAKAYAMGPIMGRFVATPDWEGLLS